MQGLLVILKGFFCAMLATVFFALLGEAALAQSGQPATATPDTVDLVMLRAAAEEHDPRSLQPGILERAARLRIEAIRTGILPQFALTGQATVQNEVTTIPIMLPDGTALGPPKEQARAQIEAEWAVYDGGRRAVRASLEQARLDENVAGVATTLYGLREATTEAYFGMLLLQAQAQIFALNAEDLAARLTLLRKRADEGAMLAADVATMEAEYIRVRQQIADIEADHRAALAVLSDLTGLKLTRDVVFVLPDLVTDNTNTLVVEARPEFTRFAATERRAEIESRLAQSALRPTVSLFGQAGMGRPSPYNLLSDEVSEYALAGVRIRWTPFDWGRTRREAEAARLQAEIASTEAEAFAQRLRRDVEDEIATLERLQVATAQDDRAVALREEALRVARRQLDEGVLLPDVYTDRLTDLAEARLVRERHRIEQARAQARLLSTLGRFPDQSSVVTLPHFDE